MEWMAVLPAAVATTGTSALNPWQDEASAAEVLCAGGSAAAFHDLDAWAEAAVWNREARGVWAVARRARGTDRVDAVRLLAERNHIGDCPLVRVLERARMAGDEAPVLVPTHGDPAATARHDADALNRLRRGEALSRPGG